ncbi:hypothetical protein PFDG_01927 [Plasmodium falciparum Dd2]|uniref:3-phosphoshikimate 1-carboxyvinyltransferase n=1 Tax=Plasmodium falciparum (isolate Dd2) TaxID=57267 RepID=A0A0L7LZV9_PLAF4|nr:hypothetical protein PFDG_01927 [Plasmodium falciparum Dd2]
MNNLNNQICNKLINNYYNKKENNNDKNDHGNSHPQGNNNHQNKQNNILINRNTKETKPLKGIHTRLSTVNVGYGIKDAIGQIFKYKHKYNEYLNYGILCELRILYELNIIDLIYLLEVEEIMRRYNMKYEINETYLSLHIKDVIHNLYVSNYIVYLNYLVLFNPVHISKIKKNILIQIPMDIILKVLCPNVFISSYKKTNIININENSIYLIDSSDKENDRPMSSKRKRESKYKKVEKKKNSKEKCDKKITNEVTITNTELNNEGIKEETKELINEANNPSIKKDTTEFFLETNMKRKNILLPHTGNKSESIRVIYASCLSSNKIYLRNINMCYDVVVFIKILRDLHFPIMLKGRKIDKYIDNIINIQKKVYSEEMEKIDDEKRFTSVESINNSFNINNMENIFRIQNVSYLERVAILECKKYCKGEKKYKYNNFNKNHRIKKKKCNVCKCTEQEKKNLGKISKEYMTACIEHSSLSYFFLKKEKNVIIIEGNVDKSDTLFKNFVFKKKVILNVYNCGTVCRFILPLLCLYICKQNIKAQEENKTKIKYIILKGCKQMENVRIIHPLVNVLRKCFKYIKIKYLKKKHYLPISISIKKHILNITHHDIFLTKQIYVDNYYSSQFISSLLLISPFSKNNTKLCLNYKHSYKTKNMINNDYTNKYIINKQKNIFYNNIKNNIKYKIRYLYNISHQEKKKIKKLTFFKKYMLKKECLLKNSILNKLIIPHDCKKGTMILNQNIHLNEENKNDITTKNNNNNNNNNNKVNNQICVQHKLPCDYTFYQNIKKEDYKQCGLFNTTSKAFIDMTLYVMRTWGIHIKVNHKGIYYVQKKEMYQLYDDNNNNNNNNNNKSDICLNRVNPNKCSSEKKTNNPNSSSILKKDKEKKKNQMDGKIVTNLVKGDNKEEEGNNNIIKNDDSASKGTNEHMMQRINDAETTQNNTLHKENKLCTTKDQNKIHTKINSKENEKVKKYYYYHINNDLGLYFYFLVGFIIKKKNCTISLKLNINNLNVKYKGNNIYKIKTVMYQKDIYNYYLLNILLLVGVKIYIRQHNKLNKESEYNVNSQNLIGSKSKSSKIYMVHFITSEISFNKKKILRPFYKIQKKINNKYKRIIMNQSAHINIKESKNNIISNNVEEKNSVTSNIVSNISSNNISPYYKSIKENNKMKKTNNCIEHILNNYKIKYNIYEKIYIKYETNNNHMLSFKIVIDAESFSDDFFSICILFSHFILSNINENIIFKIKNIHNQNIKESTRIYHVVFILKLFFHNLLFISCTNNSIYITKMLHPLQNIQFYRYKKNIRTNNQKIYNTNYIHNKYEKIQNFVNNSKYVINDMQSLYLYVDTQNDHRIIFMSTILSLIFKNIIIPKCDNVHKSFPLFFHYAKKYLHIYVQNGSNQFINTYNFQDVNNINLLHCTKKKRPQRGSTPDEKYKGGEIKGNDIIKESDIIKCNDIIKESDVVNKNEIVENMNIIIEKDEIKTDKYTEPIKYDNTSDAKSISTSTSVLSSESSNELSDCCMNKLTKENMEMNNVIITKNNNNDNNNENNENNENNDNNENNENNDNNNNNNNNVEVYKPNYKINGLQNIINSCLNFICSKRKNIKNKIKNKIIKHKKNKIINHKKKKKNCNTRHRGNTQINNKLVLINITPYILRYPNNNKSSKKLSCTKEIKKKTFPRICESYDIKKNIDIHNVNKKNYKKIDDTLNVHKKKIDTSKQHTDEKICKKIQKYLYLDVKRKRYISLYMYNKKKGKDTNNKNIQKKKKKEEEKKQISYNISSKHNSILNNRMKYNNIIDMYKRNNFIYKDDNYKRIYTYDEILENDINISYLIKQINILNVTIICGMRNVGKTFLSKKIENNIIIDIDEYILKDEIKFDKLSISDFRYYEYVTFISSLYLAFYILTFDRNLSAPKDQTGATIKHVDIRDEKINSKNQNKQTEYDNDINDNNNYNNSDNHNLLHNNKDNQHTSTKKKIQKKVSFSDVCEIYVDGPNFENKNYDDNIFYTYTNKGITFYNKKINDLFCKLRKKCIQEKQNGEHQMTNVTIVLGGGIIEFDKSKEVLKKLKNTILIKRDIDEIYDICINDNIKPKLNGNIKDIIHRRTILYDKLSNAFHFIIPSENMINKYIRHSEYNKYINRNELIVHSFLRFFNYPFFKKPLIGDIITNYKIDKNEKNDEKNDEKNNEKNDEKNGDNNDDNNDNNNEDENNKKKKKKKKNDCNHNHINNYYRVLYINLNNLRHFPYMNLLKEDYDIIHIKIYKYEQIKLLELAIFLIRSCTCKEYKIIVKLYPQYFFTYQEYIIKKKKHKKKSLKNKKKSNKKYEFDNYICENILHIFYKYKINIFELDNHFLKVAKKILSYKKENIFFIISKKEKIINKLKIQSDLYKLNIWQADIIKLSSSNQISLTECNLLENILYDFYVDTINQPANTLLFEKRLHNNDKNEQTHILYYNATDKCLFSFLYNNITHLSYNKRFLPIIKKNKMYGYLSNIKEDHTNQNIQSESYYTQSSYYNRVKPILFYTIIQNVKEKNDHQQTN